MSDMDDEFWTSTTETVLVECDDEDDNSSDSEE